MTNLDQLSGEKLPSGNDPRFRTLAALARIDLLHDARVGELMLLALFFLFVFIILACHFWFCWLLLLALPARHPKAPRRKRFRSKLPSVQGAFLDVPRGGRLQSP